MITDNTGRSFKKLRISLTNTCNYSCIYCSFGSKPDQTIQDSISEPVYDSKKILPESDLLEIIKRLHVLLNLKVVRLTGGEPMLHHGIVRIVSAIRNMGINQIGMTTNGHFLKNKAKALVNAGLNSVNISLDAFSDNKFTEMSQYSGFSRVINSIDACVELGLIIKINTVVMAGKNETEILPLLDFAMEKGIVIRFLELMPMGPLHNKRNGQFFSCSQIIALIQARYSITPLPREVSSTANYWSIDGKKAFGIIANDSSPFCNDCNRLRLDSYGNIYGCLSSLIPIQVNSNSGQEEIIKALNQAITHKQPTHFIGNMRTMKSIGG